MPAGKKVVGLAVIVAIATAMNTFVAVPAFPQSSPLSDSRSSTYTPSDNNSNISALDIARPILLGGVAALALTTLGLATALLSGKNKEQVEGQLKSAREIANAVKTRQFAFNLSASRSQNITDESQSSLSLMAAELIESYHTQALTQAAAQFWFSVSAATIGFVFIIYIESIENQELRDLVKAQWALQIVGLESHPVDLAAYSSQLPLPNESVYKGEQKKSSLTEKENPSTRRQKVRKLIQ
jgi:hypothetical protein